METNDCCCQLGDKLLYCPEIGIKWRVTDGSGIFSNIARLVQVVVHVIVTVLTLQYSTLKL